ncbi:hypothetical protein C8J55DRAFT_489525 [Lentinula edodes]|uniref:Uncharacterized protein n=1 Tax=Lentinula lateritia TaxID=40482 RepID=A0A9W9DNK5_9AGAR|nr:hypothetical protein C8J55DRAFT_489525 [Lentinula edodes]
MYWRYNPTISALVEAAVYSPCTNEQDLEHWSQTYLHSVFPKMILMMWLSGVEMKLMSEVMMKIRQNTKNLMMLEEMTAKEMMLDKMTAKEMMLDKVTAMKMIMDEATAKKTIMDEAIAKEMMLDEATAKEIMMGGGAAKEMVMGITLAGSEKMACETQMRLDTSGIEWTRLKMELDEAHRDSTFSYFREVLEKNLMVAEVEGIQVRNVF